MKQILLTLFLLTLSVFVFAQPAGITEIRRLYKETTSKKYTYKQLTQDDFENSSEGGELTAYIDSEEVRLIEAKYYGHMGNSESEYYYFNNKIYFIYRKDYRYNMPPTQSGYDQNKTALEESRFYFWDNKMIRWINPDGEHINPESAEFLEESTKRSSWATAVLGMVK